VVKAMSLQIQCPECNHHIGIKSIKVGSFKPTCTHCGKPFGLVVKKLEPFEHVIQRIAAKAISPAPPSLASMAQTNTPAVAERVAESLPPTVVPNEAATKGGKVEPAFSTVRQASESNAAQDGSQLYWDEGGASQAAAPPVERLGGYRIVRELGRGGMGSVFLAKQLSLDRSVAVKTIQAQWAANPKAIARFIREAYAAAQLTHHNVVQVYDLAEDSGINFFSMELIEGGSLQDLMKNQGKVAPQQAASLILQAARGLKFAHDHGLVHRDIKPANLMLNRDGLVKIADLGLVKTPHVDEAEISAADSTDRREAILSARSEVTGEGATMGTPAYMSPEQAEDASKVDARADIYSLGCTLYALLSGQPPWGGSSPIEIISKLKTDSIAPIQKAVPEVPDRLAAIISRMTAKHRDDRFPDLQGVMEELESYLASALGAASNPIAEHIENLKAAKARFTRLPTSAPTRWFVPAVSLALLVLAGSMLPWSWRISLTALSMVVAFLGTCLILQALLEGRSAMGSRARLFLWTSRWPDWLTWCASGLFLLLMAFVFDLFGHLVVGAILAIGLGCLYHFLLRAPLIRRRADAQREGEAVLRSLRLSGQSENQIRDLAASGDGAMKDAWLEGLFGYDVARQIREQARNEGKAKRRPIDQWVRDWVAERMDGKIQQRRQQREEKLLKRVEVASLKADGLSDSEAHQRASNMAAALVESAQIAKQASMEYQYHGKDASAIQKREKIKRMMAEARSGKSGSLARSAARSLDCWLHEVVGGKFRFVLGGALVALCGMWLQQNGLLSSNRFEEVKKAAMQASDTVRTQGVENVQDLGQLGKSLGSTLGTVKTKPLDLPVVGPFFQSFAPGVIGLLIMASCLIIGWRYSIFAALAAISVLLAPGLPLPAIPFLGGRETMGLLAGVVVLMVGLVLGRTTSS
jgi:serine/threonine protein kinase